MLFFLFPVLYSTVLSARISGNAVEKQTKALDTYLIMKSALVRWIYGCLYCTAVEIKVGNGLLKEM